MKRLSSATTTATRPTNSRGSRTARPRRRAIRRRMTARSKPINVERLIKVIQRVKRETQVPVTTGEIWSVWQRSSRTCFGGRLHRRAHSALLGRQVRPRPPSTTRSARINRLRQMYPGKRIVIAEFGWPSAGYNLKDAIPGRLEQATVLRDFVSRAEALSASTTTSSKRSTSRGKPRKAASAPIGACSMHRGR